MTNSSLSGNTATSGSGGGIFNGGGTLALTSSSLSGNTATNGMGGGIFSADDLCYHSYAMLTMSNSSLSGNAALFGGGIYNYGTLTMTNSSLSGNKAEHGPGGGISNQGTLVMTSSSLSGNTADSGGGIANGYEIVISRSSFNGNTAVFEGGGIANFETMTMNNSVLSGNAASLGGGISNYRVLNLDSSTLSGNTAANGGGIRNYNTLTMSNSILWRNTALLASDQIENEGGIGGSAAHIYYSDIQGSGGSGAGWDTDLGTDGGGNIDADPLFYRAPHPGTDGKWGTVDDDYGDLRLRLASPAIDAGDNDGVPAGITADLDGRPRFVDVPSVPDTGNGSPPIVDMGAYESVGMLLFLPAIRR